MDNKNKVTGICKKKLPKGWSRHVVKRLQGRSEGKLDIYVYSPEGKKFRSKNEIATYLKRAGINNIDVDVFDFSTRNTTVVIPKGNKLVKASPQIKAPVKRKVESPSVILTKKRKLESLAKVQSPASATITKSTEMNTSKTVAERRASLTKFTASVKSDPCKPIVKVDAGNLEDDAESGASNMSEVFVKISDKSETIIITLPVTTDIPAETVAQNTEILNEILLTTEDVKTDLKSNQQIEEENLTQESAISEHIMDVEEDESTCGSIQSISNIPMTRLGTTGEQSSTLTNIEDETVDSDVSDHVDVTHLRLAMLQQMTAVRRNSDISSEDDSSVQSIISEQATETQDTPNLISTEKKTNGMNIDDGHCISTTIVVTSEDDVNTVCQISQLSSDIKNEEPVSSPQHISPKSNQIPFEDEKEELLDVNQVEQQSVPIAKSENESKAINCYENSTSPCVFNENGEMELSQSSKKDSETNDSEKSNGPSDDIPPVCNETESDFVNGMLLPDKIDLNLVDKEVADIKNKIKSINSNNIEKETKNKEEIESKHGNTSTNSDHEPFETEHAMVKKLLENNEVHLYKPALSEEIEEMLTDIDQEADEINQEAFVLKLGLEKIKEDSNELKQETEHTEKIEESEKELKLQEEETAEAKLEAVDHNISVESSEESEDKNNQSSELDDEVPLTEPFSFERKEMPDIINIDNQDNICEKRESEINEPLFEMPDIINTEKPIESDANTDGEIRMPELEPMVPTEIKKCDEPAQYSQQKRVLIDWPAILTAVEESSDSDSSSSIDSFDSDSLIKSEDESSSSTGDTPPISKKLKISPYFKNSSDNKKNIMKCKYFKTKTSDGTDITDPKEIIKGIIWIPPKSPYNLIQESLYQEPWKLLIATIFLNRTSGKVAIPLVWKFFDRWATPEAAYSADKAELAQFLQPMGINNRRADQIMRFSYEFKHKAWLYPKELFGISKYGNDSFRIFCRNEWRKVKPLDHKLNMYHNWLCQNWKALGV